MKGLFLCVVVTMLAFTGNSVLTRLALADKTIAPGIFVLLRLGSGAAVLFLMIGWQKSFGALWGPKRISGTLALSFYMLGRIFICLYQA